jgi:transcriptional regulator of arginine metabolism
MPPAPRRHRILQLLRARTVRSQQELQRLLRQQGIAVTQATLSRDLHELGVVKGPEGYRPPPADAPPPLPELPQTIGRELLDAAVAGTLVVLRTLPGHANPLALAIDGAGLDEVVGTIAGDDTVFLATESGPAARRLANRLERMAGHPQEEPSA